MSDLPAKARRAAEWWSMSTGKGHASYHAHIGWCITENGSSWADATTITDRLLIAFCEDRGWQDQEQEADGVEWKTKVIDSAMIGKLMVVARVEPDGSHTWSVWDNETWDEMASADGTAPTRAEARRQAVEAARGIE